MSPLKNEENEKLMERMKGFPVKMEKEGKEEGEQWRER